LHWYGVPCVTETVSTPRPYHHGNLREELLERATELVRERGVAELSLRALAREAGVSHAAPGRHFPDRQALLDALALRGWERLGVQLAEAARSRAKFEGRMTRVATAYARFATREAALLELMFASKKMELDGPLHAAAEAAFATILALIAEGQASGDLRADEPEATGLILFAALQGVASLSVGGMIEEDALDGVVRDAVRTLLDGLRPR